MSSDDDQSTVISDDRSTVSGVDRLVVDGVRAGYGETEVLSDVSLRVGDGEVVALVGRNGAGKTTTLRCIVGTVTPRTGTIALEGEDVTGASPTEIARRGVGYVPEDRRVFPGLTVVENLKIGSFGGGSDSTGRSVESVLDTFDLLANRSSARGTDLSGGEQQILAIARALVAGADLLLLDEPTEGLAPLIVEQVEELVRDLSESGITVLLVEQNLAVAMALADRIYVLDQGRIVFEGTPADLEGAPEVRDRHLGVTT